jgi:DNA mismatch repair protein MutS2
MRQMSTRFGPGDAVQTPLGKGVVRDVMKNGRLRVDVRDRILVLDEDAVSALPASGRRGRDLATRPVAPVPALSASRHVSADVDLHGLTVEEALGQIDRTLNDALLAGALEIRFIHGRSGGRLRGALHARLRQIASVRGFHLDPRNDGVTVVSL